MRHAVLSNPCARRENLSTSEDCDDGNERDVLIEIALLSDSDNCDVISARCYRFPAYQMQSRNIGGALRSYN